MTSQEPARLAMAGTEQPAWTIGDGDRRFRAIFESTAIGIAILDLTGRLIEANRSLQDLLGYASGELAGKPFIDLLHPAHIKATLEYFNDLIVGKRDHVQLELRCYRKNGGVIWVQATASLIRDERGTPEFVIVMLSNITERKQAERIIKRMAYYDPLTELPNRLLFKDRLTQALAQAERNHEDVAILFLDLDGFKHVNDTLGHAMGDRLLQAVAKRLTGCLRKSDTVARLGGDEFMILLSGGGRVQDAVTVAQKILDALKPPFSLDGHNLFISASIGISLYPRDGEDAETLLRNVDIAMYRAKDLGRNTYQLYAPALNDLTFATLALENRLRRALAAEEFFVLYQPLVHLRTGRIFGVEALVRWHDPEYGILSPAHFIATAERTGLIVPLGEWVLRRVCAQVKAWQNAGLTPVCASVNLSAHQFQQPTLVDTIERILKETGVEPRYLGLEITESTAIKSVDFTVEMLRALTSMGVQVSMDDFGTGYSSLAYLKRFPIHLLKIDQSFIRDLVSDPNDTAITSAIIALGHALHLAVVAEGVETAEQLAVLRDLGCDGMQGYLFSGPVSAEVLTEYLATGRRLIL